MNPTGPSHIELTPGTCGGQPRISGHRIRVQDVVVWHETHGLSPDQIVSEFPQLTLGDVYAALAYYHDHRDEINRQMREEEEFVAAMRRKLQRNGRARKARKRTRGNPISSRRTHRGGGRKRTSAARH